MTISFDETLFNTIYAKNIPDKILITRERIERHIGLLFRNTYTGRYLFVLFKINYNYY